MTWLSSPIPMIWIRRKISIGSISASIWRPSPIWFRSKKPMSYLPWQSASTFTTRPSARRQRRPGPRVSRRITATSPMCVPPAPHARTPMLLAAVPRDRKSTPRSPHGQRVEGAAVERPAPRASTGCACMAGAQVTGSKQTGSKHRVPAVETATPSTRDREPGAVYRPAVAMRGGGARSARARRGRGGRLPGRVAGTSAPRGGCRDGGDRG